DEVLQHFFGDLEVGDDAVLHRPDRLDIAGRATEHALGFGADGFDRFLTVVDADGDDRGLVVNNALAAYIKESVGGTEIDGEIAGKDPSAAFQHVSDHSLNRGDAPPGSSAPLYQRGRLAATAGFRHFTRL